MDVGGFRLLIAAILFSSLLTAQTPATSVEKIYVDGIGQKSSLDNAKKELISELRKLKSVEIVKSPAEANAILSGDGEIYVKGYYSLNPRSGLSPANGTPIYAGYLSVELKDASGATLWSYLANASDSKNAVRDLTRNVVKHLAAILPRKS